MIIKNYETHFMLSGVGDWPCSTCCTSAAAAAWTSGYWARKAVVQPSSIAEVSWPATSRVISWSRRDCMLKPSPFSSLDWSKLSSKHCTSSMECACLSCKGWNGCRTRTGYGAGAEFADCLRVCGVSRFFGWCSFSSWGTGAEDVSHNGHLVRQEQLAYIYMDSPDPAAWHHRQCGHTEQA